MNARLEQRIEELRKERDTLVADRDALAKRAGKMWMFLKALKDEANADLKELLEMPWLPEEGREKQRSYIQKIEEAMR
jgi:hypothetical protein